MTLRAVASISICAAIATYVVVRRLRNKFQFVVVNGESMRPTFRHGDLVVGRRNATVSRGDVAVFKVYPNDYEDRAPSGPSRRLKRIVALAGEPVPAFLPDSLKQRHGGFVPRGHIALAGDAPVSEGSAEFGYINIERVESIVRRRLRRGHSPAPKAAFQLSTLSDRTATRSPGYEP